MTRTASKPPASEWERPPRRRASSPSSTGSAPKGRAWGWLSPADPTASPCSCWHTRRFPIELPSPRLTMDLPAAADECAMVAQVCAARDIACTVLEIETAPGNVQAAARTARYAALGAWAESAGLTALATAHHAHDQAETLVMRLNRASGLAGLAGVRARGTVPGGTLPVIRPLLHWRRDELAAIVARAGLQPVQDPSNADVADDRVRIRQALSTAGLARSRGDRRERRTSCRGRRGDRVDGRTRDG